MIKYSIFSFCLLLISVFTTFNSAQAQFTIEQSSAEDVMIAFYKTGATIPDFENWIIGREPYNKTPWAMRERVYEAEQLRLIEKYETFKPAEDFLKVRSQIKIDFEEFEALNPETGVDEKHIIMKAVFFEKDDAKIYFPFQFLNQYVSMLPDNVDDFTSAIVTKDEFEFISQNVSSRPTVYIEMIPFKAQTDAPVNIDGQDQWALHTKIVSFLVINDKGTVIWEKTAPWYVSPETKSLNELYEGQYR